ncbi:hypothetical protein C8R44DRAFT_869739 [Mycena epipterygia]|nr:hypothetical protein C8R44DRAFT_869739 [Mycena epipterygia]
MVDVSPRPPTFQSYALLRESLRSAPPTSLISHLPQTPPRTKPRRSRSSPPSLTRPESKIVPGPTPPCDLEQYLLEDYAYYVPEERGVTSIIEGMGQQEDFRVPATIESVTRLSNKVFTPHFCETLAQYYAGLHEDGAYGPCDAFGALRVADVFSNILNDLLVSPQFRENVRAPAATIVLVVVEEGKGQAVVEREERVEGAEWVAVEGAEQLAAKEE